ncbi:cell division protein FtsZ [Rhizobiales bacterium]|uniref:cell division protein FtsZ n=1 Tax=Hongsoonwoonella zoysiae TaxID=2821844 RepID=UPI001560A1A1|nr:cell division protein FtsZ [Hongsoonwoonella zoysiae]NRG17845.1 cell division protein FtsZ [Hongsoonwoonella zoysiae]
MTINLQMPDIQELKPRITVFGVGGAGGNAVNNMIQAGLQGCDFVVANTDAQALATNHAERVVQMGVAVTEGLGAGSQPDVGAAAAEEVIDEINDHLAGSHMVFITAGMGGGTGTGAAPVIARAAREKGILTVGVVTKPFQFEGARRMRVADSGIEELQKNVDTLIVIPNQNLFRIANAQTTFADAFAMADQVLYSGVACITDLMVKEGLINLDFADVRSIMRGMGKAMMGTGEASGEKRAMQAAEAAIANPLLDETSMMGARGLLISITGGNDLTLFEVDEAATRIREEVDPDANIIMGATFDESLDGIIRVSVVATGIDKVNGEAASPVEARVAEITERLQEQPKPAAPRVAAPQRPSVTARAVESLERELEIGEPEGVAASTDPAVEIKPFKPAPEMMEDEPTTIEEIEEQLSQPAPEADQPAPYIPPVAENAEGPVHIPSIEDFPPVAQREMRAYEDEADHHDDHEHHEDRRPMSLLRRLASGLSRRDEHHEEDERPEMPVEPRMAERAHPAPARSQPAAHAPASQPAAHRQPQPQAAPARPVAPRAPQPRPQAQGASGQLDTTGRPAPQPRPMSEEDQLEIPAFLRRQAN